VQLKKSPIVYFLQAWSEVNSLLTSLTSRSGAVRASLLYSLSILLNVIGIAGQAGKKKSQSKLDAEKLGLLEQNKEVADMLDEMSSDR
jgi:hypothetical protein